MDARLGTTQPRRSLQATQGACPPGAHDVITQILTTLEVSGEEIREAGWQVRLGASVAISETEKTTLSSYP